MTTDAAFAARLYAVTFYLQHGFAAKVGAVAVARGITWAEAREAITGIDYKALAGAA